jgi:hypothetical protein
MNRSNCDGLKLLLTSVKQKADRAPLPPIRAYLPEQQLIQGTQRYALGPVGFDAALDSLGEPKYTALTPEVGFKSGAEAVFAAYSAGRNQAQHLLIIDYPTPQLAEQHLRHLQSLLAANPALAGTTVERKASLLSLVLSPGSAEAVAKLRDQINYETQVTWNEPSFAAGDALHRLDRLAGCGCAAGSLGASTRVHFHVARGTTPGRTPDDAGRGGAGSRAERDRRQRLEPAV